MKKYLITKHQVDSYTDSDPLIITAPAGGKLHSTNTCMSQGAYGSTAYIIMTWVVDTDDGYRDKP